MQDEDENKEEGWIDLQTAQIACQKLGLGRCKSLEQFQTKLAEAIKVQNVVMFLKAAYGPYFETIVRLLTAGSAEQRFVKEEECLV